MRAFDALIIGGGPAGAATAIWLALDITKLCTVAACF